MKNSFRNNTLFLVLYITFFMTSNYIYAQAVSSADVNAIRQRSLLREEDMGKIKSYVTDGLNSMLDAKDPSDKLLEVAAINQSLSTQKDVKDMYSSEYTKAVLEAVANIQTQLAGMEDKEKADTIFLHTVQAIANTDNFQAIDSLLKYSQDSNINIRFCSIAGFSKPSLTEYFASNEGQSNYKKVTDTLKSILEKENSAEVIGIIADAAILNTDTGIDLISSCVQKRASQYKTWKNVGNEMVDFAILSKILSTVRSGVNADFKRKDSSLMAVAAEIYNLAWQRYYLGSKQVKPGTEEEYCIFNNTTSKSNLLTILVEGELTLGSLCDDDSTAKMNGSNLLRNSWQVLERRVDKLVGLRGLIHTKFDIYGNKTDTGLTVLTDPPAEMLENALNLAELDSKLLEIEF